MHQSPQDPEINVNTLVTFWRLILILYAYILKAFYSCWPLKNLTNCNQSILPQNIWILEFLRISFDVL